MLRALARYRSPLPAAPSAGATVGSGEREEGRGPPERGAPGRGSPARRSARRATARRRRALAAAKVIHSTQQGNSHARRWAAQTRRALARGRQQPAVAPFLFFRALADKRCRGRSPRPLSRGRSPRGRRAPPARRGGRRRRPPARRGGAGARAFLFYRNLSAATESSASRNREGEGHLLYLPPFAQ